MQIVGIGVIDMGNKILQFLKVLFRVASVAAPVAASVAKATGNDEVVEDIDKAGAAANAASKVADVVSNFDEFNEVK